jgi:F0F1-type ATP synthase assembly protein I
MPDAEYYARMGRLSAIIMILPSCMAGGWLLGYYAIDHWLGSFPLGGIVMTLLGAAAGFYEIVVLLKRDAGNAGPKNGR